MPPVSLVLAADAKAYVAGLTAFRDRPADWLLLSSSRPLDAAVKDRIAKIAAYPERAKARARAGSSNCGLRVGGPVAHARSGAAGTVRMGAFVGWREEMPSPLVTLPAERRRDAPERARR